MATYYVSVSGSNSNNGLTTSTPWQTPQWAADNAIAAGDIIALKKGDVFLVNNVIEITHGGSIGNIITWDGSLWGAGVNAIVRSNVDGGNAPIWNAFVHIAACQYVTLQNITFDGNAKNRFGIVIGGDHSTYGPTHQNNEAYITVQYCEILNFGRGSFYCLSLTAQTWNTNMSNITFKGNIIDGCGAEAVGSYCGRSDEGSPPATPAQNNNLYIGYNTISNFGRSGSLGEGIQINNKTINAVVEHNIITDGPSGTGVGMSIEHNEPNAGYFPTGLIVRYNKITMTKQNTWCLLMQQGEAITADIYSNIFINENISNSTASSGGGGFVVYVNYTRPYNGAVINLYNNTFYSKSGNCIYSECNTNGALRLKNNIFYNQASAGASACFLDYFGYTTHNNNLYYRSAGISELKVQYSSSYYYTTANVQGWEATAEVGNPLFTSIGTDFHIGIGSPAIGQGITISPSIPADYDGNIWDSPPSIGAYEYGIVVPILPSVVTTSVTGITQTTATGNGNITSNGGSAITVSGVCWGTTIDPTTSNSKTIDGPLSGTFSSSIVGLFPATIYYLRAYATNAINTSYGVSIQFVTSTTVVAPTVVTNTATNITYTTALVSVTVTSLGGETPGNFFGGVLVSTTPNPTYPSPISSSNANNVGTFTTTFTALTANTLYYCRAYGINTAGTSYGAQLTFTTSPYTPPNITTFPITNITTTTASSGGGPIHNGGQSITAKGVCWSVTTDPTIANSHTTDGSGNDGWFSSITGLTFNTTYYVRAYATNSAGTGYGNQLSFTTAGVIPTLLTNNITSITTTTAVSGGNTLNDNGSSITGKGVCWSTSPTPTIADNHTHDSSGTGNYSSLLSGLIEDTDYYVRAYATNSIGTGYGPENGFKTQTIQEQTVVQNATVHKWFVWPSGSDYGALYNWYAVNSGNSIKYGYLYNWYAATDVRNIANTGWHVPTYAQFDIMRTYLGGFLLAGGPLKETGLTYWDSPNTGATNSSGFSARGSGIRFVVGGLFGDIKQDMTLMLADSFDLTQSLSADIVYQNATFFDGITKKGNGLSIRLMKDSTILTNGQTGTYTGNDGKVYNTICIGTQEWLSENLAETRYQNNDVIVEVTDGAAWEVLITGARCVYDNNVNDIAPTGWHVAAWTELSNLEISLTIAALKKAGIEHWLTNNGTDNFGFHLLGSGYRNDVGGFGSIKVQSSIWASTSWYDSPVFWTVFDGLTSGWSIGNNNGCSVRCVKDSTTLSIGQTGIVVDYDGNIYATVCMPDGKEWMKKNLKVTNYNDGTPIPIITDSTDWANDVGGAMCYYNNNINNA